MSTITQRVVKRARSKGVVVFTRWQWRSTSGHIYAFRRKFKKHALLPDHPVDTVWFHISVTADTGKTNESFLADMRTLERIGNARFGSGISYNFAVDMQTGAIGVGQPLDAKGTHTINHKHANTPSGGRLSYDQNLVSLGIVFVGMPGETLTRAAVLAVERLLVSLIEEKAVTRGFDLLPHSLVAAKDCPTDAVRDRIPAIHAAVDKHLQNKAK